MDNIIEFPLLGSVEVSRIVETFHAENWLPKEVRDIGNHQTELPRIAKNAALIAQIGLLYTFGECQLVA